MLLAKILFKRQVTRDYFMPLGREGREREKEESNQIERT